MHAFVFCTCQRPPPCHVTDLRANIGMCGVVGRQDEGPGAASKWSSAFRRVYSLKTRKAGCIVLIVDVHAQRRYASLVDWCVCGCERVSHPRPQAGEGGAWVWGTHCCQHAATAAATAGSPPTTRLLQLPAQHGGGNPTQVDAVVAVGTTDGVTEHAVGSRCCPIVIPRPLPAT